MLKKITYYLTFILFFTFSLTANAEEYDIYIHDDGSNCMLLIDVASLNIAPEHLKQPEQQKIHDYLIAALKTVEQEKCTTSAHWEAVAIQVGNRDAYGQPDWSEVVTLQNYAINLKNLQDLKNKTIIQSDANQILELQQKHG
jgi:hypothetical protein